MSCPDADDYDEFGPYCSVCHAELQWETCWHCGGEGGWHDCGEDCCPCADPEPNERCDVCGGEGRYLQCPNLPHEE